MNELSEALEAAGALASRFVVFPDARYPDVVALWAAHTHAIEAFEVTPYLDVTSPQLESGKTRLLEVLELLCARAWLVAEPSEAVAFRRIARDTPTMLLDEVDVIFERQRSDSQAGLKAVLNVGYRRGATVDRADGFGSQLNSFPVFCPKAFAGIGRNLPETVKSRSIKVQLQRRLASEPVERWKRRDVGPEGSIVRDMLSTAARGAAAGLAEWREHVPDEELLPSDRQQEIWEPLFAVAEAAGGKWPSAARGAARWTCELREAEPSVDSLLLQHIREMFDGQAAIGSQVLLDRLRERDDGPWASWWDDRNNAADLTNLARRLRPYGAGPKPVRVGGAVMRGYQSRDFADAWARYLDVEPEGESEDAQV